MSAPLGAQKPESETGMSQSEKPKSKSPAKRQECSFWPTGQRGPGFSLSKDPRLMTPAERLANFGLLFAVAAERHSIQSANHTTKNKHTDKTTTL